MLKTRPSSCIFNLALGICLTACSSQDSAERRFNQRLTIASSTEPTSFDPRSERNLDSVTFLKMLYEGLVTVDKNGAIQLALAESYTISNDLKTYTFKLRHSKWSDGSPVTASDFLETWKSMLQPTFAAPNAYQLYLIKGAKKLKENGDGSDLGIHAPASDTLVVELNEPGPYFLKLLSCFYYLPVHGSTRNHSKESSELIVNGPFKLKQVTPHNDITFEKNLAYWDAQSIKLNQIDFHILDERTALQLYLNNEIDWTGSPLSLIPQDAINSLESKGELQAATSAGTHWFRVNTLSQPFTNKKIRRAFGLALNRKELVDQVLQGKQIPAFGIVPPSFGLSKQDFFKDNDITDAAALFNEGLNELGLSRENLPKITLNYVYSERTHKLIQAIQQQWNKTFGINIGLESNERVVLLDKMRQGNYQLSLGSWYADFQDPINFLEIFAAKSNSTNQTGWENPQYTALINQSNTEKDPEARAQILTDCQALLMDSMPVIPIYYNVYNYMHISELKKVNFSSMGFLDFRDAYIENRDDSH